MYKKIEITAERLVCQGERQGAPLWLINYCDWLIDRAKSYRQSADNKEHIKSLGPDWRRNRFTKAVVTAQHAADTMRAFLRANVEK